MKRYDIANLEQRMLEYVGDIDPASKKGARRRAMLEVAIRLFAERGYRGTSMDDVAAEVGVAKGTLYLYFPKKVDLLIACTALEKLQWVPRLLGILTADEPAAHRLKQWIVAALELPTKSPLMMRLLEDPEMQAVMADIPDALRSEQKDAFPQLMGPLLKELAGDDHRWNDVELRDRANVIASIGYLGPMLRHVPMASGMAPDRFAAIFADFIVDGLRPRVPSTQDSSS